MRNSTGGKKFKKRKTNSRPTSLVVKDETEAYGIVEKNLGGRHFQVRILNTSAPQSTETLLCVLRGTLARRKSSNFVAKDSIVLLSLRDYEPDKADILQVYTQNQVMALMRQGEIPHMADFTLDEEQAPVAETRAQKMSYEDIYRLDEDEEKQDTSTTSKSAPAPVPIPAAASMEIAEDDDDEKIDIDDI